MHQQVQALQFVSTHTLTTGTWEGGTFFDRVTCVTQPRIDTTPTSQIAIEKVQKKNLKKNLFLLQKKKTIKNKKNRTKPNLLETLLSASFPPTIFRVRKISLHFFLSHFIGTPISISIHLYLFFFARGFCMYVCMSVIIKLYIYIYWLLIVLFLVLYWCVYW